MKNCALCNNPPVVSKFMNDWVLQCVTEDCKAIPVAADTFEDAVAYWDAANPPNGSDE